MNRILSVFFLLMTLTFNLVYAASSNELIGKANQAFAQKEYSSALIHLKNAAKEDPRNLQIRLELVKLFVFTGQGVQAEAEVDKALRLNATPSQITILQAKAQLLQGEFDAITDGFNFIDLPQKDIARIRALQGHAFFEKRQFKQARLMYQRAYLLAPEPLEVQLGQSRLFKIDGNEKQEKLLIESLLSQHPNNPEVQLFAAEFYRSHQQINQALVLFKQAGEVQAANVNVWFGVVRSYIAMGQFKQAKDEIQKVLFNYPEHQVGNYLLAVIAYEQGDYSRAKSAIEIVLKGKKRNFEALRLLGTIQFQQKKFSSAEKNLKKYLKFNANDVQAQKTLASVYLKRKQGTLAVKILHPLEETNDAFIFSMLANAYQMMGNTLKSEAYLLNALKIAPNNQAIKSQYQRTKLEFGETLDITFSDTEFNDFLGKGHIPILNLLRQKKYAEATKIINGYLKKSPNSGLLYYLLGSTSLYQNKITQAKTEFSRSISLSPRLVESKINLAKIFMRENNDGEAEKQYREALKIEVNNDSALVALAGIFHRKGNDDEMLKWLNKSRKKNNASLASREVLIDFYKGRGNIRQVIEISKEMVQIQPENIPLLVKHANNLKLSGRPDLSVRTYKKIIELNPNSASAWYGLGKMQSFDSDFEDSYRSFEKLLKLAPKSLIARIVLTKYDVKNNQPKKALIRAKELVKTHPKIADSYEILGDVLIFINKPSEAINQFEKSVNLKFRAETYIKLFSAYNRNKQHEKGFKLLKIWVKKFPSSLDLKEVLALSHQNRGEYNDARKLYEEIIKTERSKDRIFNNLALVSLKLNSPMSMEYADIAYNINAKNAKNLDTLGWVQLNNNNLSSALEHLSEAVKIAPENPDIRYHFAVALERAERFNDAKTQLALIVSIEGIFDNRGRAKVLFSKLNNKK